MITVVVHLTQHNAISLQTEDFINDYDGALTRANTFDSKLENDATAISVDYAGIVALSVRQALGAIELTISKNTDGNWNTEDVIIFMKG